MPSAPKAAMTKLQADRLDRIIESTKRLLSERDAEHLTMRDIARASLVAEGTLYNRFGSKDGLITLVIVDYFERSVLSYVDHPPKKTAVQKVLYGIDVVLRSILDAQSFARALMGSYFKLDNDREMPNRLADMVYASWVPILKEMQLARALQPWVSLHLLCSDMRDREFAVVAKWARGEIAAELFKEHMRFALLSPLLGISRGQQAREIATILEQLSRRLDPPAAAVRKAAVRRRQES